MTVVHDHLMVLIACICGLAELLVRSSATESEGLVNLFLNA
jgi:hypothetical protein